MSLIIDDSVENALDCARLDSVSVILFGDYEWNRRESKEDRYHLLTHLQRLAISRGYPWWEGDNVGVLPPNVKRVARWPLVVPAVDALTR